MLLSTLEDVLYHIRVNHYYSPFTNASNLRIVKMCDENSDMLIYVENTEDKTVTGFSVREMIAEMEKMRFDFGTIQSPEDIQLCTGNKLN